MSRKMAYRSPATSAVIAAALALFVALAAGFFVIAMPGEYLQQAVLLSGLPRLLPAAAPPLGEKARVLLAFASASVVGSTAWIFLFAIDQLVAFRKPRGPVAREATMEFASDLDHTPIFSVAGIGQPFQEEEQRPNLPSPECAAEPEVLDLADWRLSPDPEKDEEKIVEEPVEAELEPAPWQTEMLVPAQAEEKVVEFSFAMRRRAEADTASHAPEREEQPLPAADPAPAAEAPLDDASIEELLARIDAGVSNKVPPRRMAHRPDGAIQACVEELKRLAMAGRN